MFSFRFADGSMQIMFLSESEAEIRQLKEEGYVEVDDQARWFKKYVNKEKTKKLQGFFMVIWTIPALTAPSNSGVTGTPF